MGSHPGRGLWNPALAAQPAARPKFLLPLTGERSLLQQTADRLAPFAAPAQTLVVCGPAHAAAIARQLPDIPEDNLVVEPSPKGSGPAIGLAAALIARRDPDAIMGSFAADHEVRDPARFWPRSDLASRRRRRSALHDRPDPNAARDRLRLHRAQRRAAVESESGTCLSRRSAFVEKPDRAQAEEYVATGRFLWNASMFVWRAQTLSMKWRSAAGPARRFDADLRRLGRTESRSVVAEVWAGLTETTIDHGIMEHADRVAVVPAEIGWSDVGDWHGLGELIDRDAVGNASRATWCSRVAGLRRLVGDGAVGGAGRSGRYGGRRYPGCLAGDRPQPGAGRPPDRRRAQKRHRREVR